MEKSVADIDWQEDRRKSWFYRLSGVAERHIVRGVKALQRLAVPDGRLLDFQDAKLRVEKLTAEVRGQDRLEAMRRWIEILTEQEQSPCVQPVIVSQPTSADASENTEEEEEDWQQLSALPQATGPPGSGKDSLKRSSPSMYLDHSASNAEPMGFRELFLRSEALENLFAGYAEEAPSSSEEEELLAKLVNSCFGCPEGDTEALLADLTSLARAQAQCQQTGVPSEQIQAISRKVSQAVTDLKRKAAVEVLASKMKALRQEVASQAASAALLHKFNSGASEPAGEVTRQRLVQGLAATQEVMLLVNTLCQLASQQSSLAAQGPAVEHASLVDSVQSRSADLARAIADAEVQLEDNQARKQDSQAFKERKLEDMEGVAAKLQEEISGLQNERASLLAKLEKIELALTKAQATKADLQEGRTVLEDDSNFTIQGLEHKANELCNLQNQHEAEMASLAKCRQFIARSQCAVDKKQQEEQKAAAKAVNSAAQEYSHAATRHLYFQRARIQLISRQLKYCSAELAGLEEKSKHVSSLGMDNLLDDVALQRHRLMHQYLEAESACLSHLDQVDNLRTKVEAVASQASTLQESDEHQVSQSSEFEDLSRSIRDLKLEFEALKRPEGLPPPGEKLTPIRDPSTPKTPKATPGAANVPSKSLRPFSAASVASAKSQSSPEAKQDLDESPKEEASKEHNDLGLDTLLQENESNAGPSEAPKLLATEQDVPSQAPSLAAIGNLPEPPSGKPKKGSVGSGSMASLKSED